MLTVTTGMGSDCRYSATSGTSSGVHALGHQPAHGLQLRGGVVTLDLTDGKGGAVAGEFSGAALCAAEHLVKKRIADGGYDHADVGALTGANKRLGQLVGLVALTLGNVQYTLGQLGIYVAAAVEYPVDGAAAGARFFGDLLDGHASASPLRNLYRPWRCVICARARIDCARAQFQNTISFVICQRKRAGVALFL